MYAVLLYNIFKIVIFAVTSNLHSGDGRCAVRRTPVAQATLETETTAKFFLASGPHWIHPQNPNTHTFLTFRDFQLGVRRRVFIVTSMRISPSWKGQLESASCQQGNTL